MLLLCCMAPLMIYFYFLRLTLVGRTQISGRFVLPTPYPWLHPLLPGDAYPIPWVRVGKGNNDENYSLPAKFMPQTPKEKKYIKKSAFS